MLVQMLLHDCNDNCEIFHVDQTVQIACFASQLFDLVSL